MLFEDLFGIYDVELMLEGKSQEETKDILFKYFFDNHDVALFLIKNFKRYADGLYKLYFKANTIANMRESFCNAKNKIEKKLNISNDYKKILENSKKLSQELGLKSSLELCNLYTYLLWNGYFSKDKQLKYQTVGTNCIPGTYPYTIMSGGGVCLNFSEMLTDFINQFEFSSATLASNLSDYEKSYKVKIKRDIGEINVNFIDKILCSLNKIDFNHAFNLIKENNKLYIYDPTNLFIAKLKNTKEAKLIPGIGKFNLNPYYSYCINSSQKSKDTLDLLLDNNSFKCPYTEKKYVQIWNKCIELFLENKCLLNDFYIEIIDNIQNISNTISDKENIKKIKHIKR